MFIKDLYCVENVKILIVANYPAKYILNWSIVRQLRIRLISFSGRRIMGL